MGRVFWSFPFSRFDLLDCPPFSADLSVGSSSSAGVIASRKIFAHVERRYDLFVPPVGVIPPGAGESFPLFDSRYRGEVILERSAVTARRDI